MYDANRDVLTPKERPNHHAIGRYYRAWDGQVYYCDSYDPRVDYYMTNVLDASHRKDVSPRALGRTFHEIGTQDRPRVPWAIRDYSNFAVDTTLSPDEMEPKELEYADCFGLPERVALFYNKFEAERFIRIVKEAAEQRQAELAAKSATSVQ